MKLSFCMQLQVHKATYIGWLLQVVWSGMPKHAQSDAK